MKKSLLLLLIQLSFCLSVFSQTGLFAYKGGFFIRNGKSWTEYRPDSRASSWATYTSYAEDNQFYSISSSACSVSIPKNEGLNYFIAKNGKWEVLYNPIVKFDYFTDNGRNIYCHSRGYFVRDGKTWREYLPSSKHGVWAEYKQVRSDDNFIYIKSSQCDVAVPKKSTNNFYIYRSNKWEVVYNTSVIYDRNQGEIGSFDDKNSKEDDSDAAAALLLLMMLGL